METPIEQQIASGIARRIAKWIAMGIVAIIAITIFIFLGGIIVQLLWNWLLPPLFNFPQLSFWQALGLLALCRILFGGFGRGGGRRHGWGGRMSREERELLRQRMRDRCSWDQREHAPETERPAAP
jgi:hypothetical protein